MTIAFKSQFSFIEGGHVFASNLNNKTKQNQKKKPKKETVKRFSLRKKKTKQQQQQQKPKYCTEIHRCVLV